MKAKIAKPVPAVTVRLWDDVAEAQSPQQPQGVFCGLRAPRQSLGARRSRELAGRPARPRLRAHKAPGADVRAPLGSAGPQCRRSRAALPPRPRSQQPASRAAARPEPGARTCPPDLRTCAPGPQCPRGARSARPPPVSSHG